jgi:hypothetical protein
MRFSRDSDPVAPGRRWVATLALLSGLMLAGMLVPSGALAKDGQVTVRAAGTTNASVTIKLSELVNNDINNRTYRLNGGPVTISGHSLLQVMRAADAELDSFDLETIPGIEIDRPTGGPISVSGADLRNPSAFSDGPPVFYEDNGATVFVMPGRGNSTGGRFRFNFAPVGISIQSGLNYEVGLSASPLTIKAGGTVRFRATVTGQPAGEPLSYRWTFGDGQAKTTNGSGVSHLFRDDGSFPVIVVVTGASGAGRTGVLIKVGKAKADPRPEPRPEPEESDRQPPADDGTGGYGDPSGGGGYGYGTGGFGDGGGSGFASPPGSPAPAPSARQPQKPKPRPAPVPDDGLSTVTGELLNPATAPVPVERSTGQVVESADPATPGAEQGGFGVPGAAFTLAGVGLLLGLGGFAELRIFSRLY